MASAQLHRARRGGGGEGRHYLGTLQKLEGKREVNNSFSVICIVLSYRFVITVLWLKTSLPRGKSYGGFLVIAVKDEVHGSGAGNEFPRECRMDLNEFAITSCNCDILSVSSFLRSNLSPKRNETLTNFSTLNFSFSYAHTHTHCAIHFVEFASYRSIPNPYE